MTFPVIHGISPAPMEFQFEVSARIIRQDVAQVIPPQGECVAAGVVLAGVSRYTYLAAHVRQASGMADGWQRVDRVSYAKCAPVVTRRPSAVTDRQLGTRSDLVGGLRSDTQIAHSRAVAGTLSLAWAAGDGDGGAQRTAGAGAVASPPGGVRAAGSCSREVMSSLL